MIGKKRSALETLTHPAVFIGLSVCIGLLFALQEWVYSLRMAVHVPMSVAMLAWFFYYFSWGFLVWATWAIFENQIRNGSLKVMLLGFLPLSMILSVLEEMAFALVFVNLPVNHPHSTYWRRVTLYLYEEFLTNMAIFWVGFLLLRGMSYYERFRENEQIASQLEAQLANARLSALRMQLNPHFLFNTMNGISSLMRTDVEAADRMLEQLSFLMRITIERGDAQLISLREEMEFIETFLAMQGHRYSGRVEQHVRVAPELYEALVPTMLLQPIVENAFKHGLAKVVAGGKLSVEVDRESDYMHIAVRNNGASLKPAKTEDGYGLGLANVQSRLQLHYGNDYKFSIEETEREVVQVAIRLPLQFADSTTHRAEFIESAS
jgi:two-component system LytT family sensor kinase